VGARKGIFSAAFSKKIGGNTETKMAAIKRIFTDLSLETHFNSSLDEFHKG